jgi:hypothetical protein
VLEALEYGIGSGVVRQPMLLQSRNGTDLRDQVTIALCSCIVTFYIKPKLNIKTYSQIPLPWQNTILLPRFAWKK